MSNNLKLDKVYKKTFNKKMKKYIKELINSIFIIQIRISIK